MQKKQAQRSNPGSPFKVDMATHVRQQPDSGMIISEYCRAHQISEGTFYYWLKKTKNTSPAPLSTPAILPIKIVEATNEPVTSNLFAEVRGITIFQPVPAEYLLTLLNH